MLAYLELSWHAKRQDLNLTLEHFTRPPYSIAAFAHKAIGFHSFYIAAVIGHRQGRHCRNAKIALVLRLCSENARLGVNQSNSKLKQQPPNPTCISFLLIKPVCFLIVLKWQCAWGTTITCIAEMQTSLSPYACAAKSLYLRSNNQTQS